MRYTFVYKTISRDKSTGIRYDLPNPHRTDIIGEIVLAPQNTTTISKMHMPLSTFAFWVAILWICPLPRTTALAVGRRFPGRIRDCGPGAIDCGRACCKNECGINGTCKPPYTTRFIADSLVETDVTVAFDA